MVHIDSKRARLFIEKLPEKPAMDFADMYPNASEDALDLLRHLLRFSPNDRLSAKKALEHPYLADYVS